MKIFGIILLFLCSFSLAEAKRLNSLYFGVGAGGLMTHRTTKIGINNNSGSGDDRLPKASLIDDHMHKYPAPTTTQSSNIFGDDDMPSAKPINSNNIHTLTVASPNSGSIFDEDDHDYEYDDDHREYNSDYRHSNYDDDRDEHSDDKEKFSHSTHFGSIISVNLGASVTMLKFLYLGLEGSYYFTPGIDRSMYGGLSYALASNIGVALGSRFAVYGIGGFANALVPTEDLDSTYSKFGIHYGAGIKSMITDSFSIALELTGTYFNIQDNGIIPTSFDLDSMRNIFTGQVKFAYHIL